MIAVTRAGGGIGGRIARALAGREALRLVVSDRARVTGGGEVAVADHRDGHGMRAALSGVDAAFLVSASESLDPVAEHVSAVGAAAAAGVRRIVYLSFMGAAPGAVFTFARNHAAAEARIRTTGMEFRRACRAGPRGIPTGRSRAGSPYAAIAAGTLGAVTDTVERLTGRRPRPVAEFLREHPESYAHLRR